MKTCGRHNSVRTAPAWRWLVVQLLRRSGANERRIYAPVLSRVCSCWSRPKRAWTNTIAPQPNTSGRASAGFPIATASCTPYAAFQWPRAVAERRGHPRPEIAGVLLVVNGGGGNPAPRQCSILIRRERRAAPHHAVFLLCNGGRAHDVRPLRVGC